MVIRYLFPFSITIFLREWQFDTMDEDFVDFVDFYDPNDHKQDEYDQFSDH